MKSISHTFIENTLKNAIENAHIHALNNQDSRALETHCNKLYHKIDDCHALYKYDYFVKKNPATYGIKPELANDFAHCSLQDYYVAYDNYCAARADYNFTVALAHADIFEKAATPFFDRLPRELVNILKAKIDDLKAVAERSRETKFVKTQKNTQDATTRAALARIASITNTTSPTIVPIEPDVLNLADSNPTITQASSNPVTVQEESLRPVVPVAQPIITTSEGHQPLTELEKLEHEITDLLSKNLGLDFSLQPNIKPLDKIRFEASKLAFYNAFSTYKTATINFIKNKNIQTKKNYLESYINLSKELPKRSVLKASTKENLSKMLEFTKTIHEKLGKPGRKLTQLRLNFLFR